MAIPTTADGALSAFRREFVARELSLIDGKTAYAKLLKAYMPSELDAAFAEFDIRMKKPFLHVSFGAAADRAVGAFFSSPSVPDERKSAFCAAVRTERNKRAVDFRIRALDTSKHLMESTALAILAFLLFGALAIVLFQYLAGGYFVSICLCLPPLAAAISELFYWYNVKRNKLFAALAVSAWQTLVVGLTAVAAYVAIQLILRAVY